MFGIGQNTWKCLPAQVKETVKVATDAGYCPICFIYAHYNKNKVGEAIQKKIKEKVVNQKDLFIIRKLWSTCLKENS